MWLTTVELQALWGGISSPAARKKAQRLGYQKRRVEKPGGGYVNQYFVPTETTETDYKRTDQWGSDWLEHDIRNARGKCKACHAATRCADCCFLCDHRCDQYRVCEVVKQYAVDAAPYDPSDLDLIEAFKSLQTDRTMRLRIANLSDYAYSPVVKESLTTDQFREGKGMVLGRKNESNEENEHDNNDAK